MQALEIGHLRGIAGLHQSFEAGLHQGRAAAAQHRLLAEQIRFRLFPEAGFDDARPPGADGAGIGERQLLGLAAGVARHGDQAGHAAALDIGGPHRVARPFGRNHDDVQIRPRFDQLEVDVEPVGERQGRAFLQVRFERFRIQLRLKFVRGENHHQIRPRRRLAGLGHPEAGALRLGPGAGAGAQPHRQLRHPGVSQVVGMGMPLGAVADDRDLPILDDGTGPRPCRNTFACSLLIPPIRQLGDGPAAGRSPPRARYRLSTFSPRLMPDTPERTTSRMAALPMARKKASSLSPAPVNCTM